MQCGPFVRNTLSKSGLHSSECIVIKKKGCVKHSIYEQIVGAKVWVDGGREAFCDCLLYHV